MGNRGAGSRSRPANVGQQHGTETDKPTSGTAVTSSLQGKSMCLLEQTQGLHQRVLPSSLTQAPVGRTPPPVSTGRPMLRTLAAPQPLSDWGGRSADGFGASGWKKPPLWAPSRGTDPTALFTVPMQ